MLAEKGKPNRLIQHKFKFDRRESTFTVNFEIEHERRISLYMDTIRKWAHELERAARKVVGGKDRKGKHRKGKHRKNSRKGKCRKGKHRNTKKKERKMQKRKTSKVRNIQYKKVKKINVEFFKDVSDDLNCYCRSHRDWAFIDQNETLSSDANLFI